MSLRLIFRDHPGIIRQLALFSTQKRRDAIIKTSIKRSFQESSLIREFKLEPRSNFSCGTATALCKRFLHLDKIIFHEVQPLQIDTANEDMSTNPGKDCRDSPVPKPSTLTRVRKLSGGIAPPNRKGMTELDRNAFDKDIKIPTVYVFEDHLNPQAVQKFKKFMLKIIGIRPVQDVENKELVSLSSGDASDLSSSRNASARKQKKIYINPDLVKGHDLAEFVQHEIQPDPSIVASVGYETVKLKYENWNLTQIVDSVLPDEEDKVSSFSQIGHIVHLNLRDHLLPYKKLIGEIFLDKVSNAKTVVNKINIIESKYRNFQMELLAGDPKTVVTVKENRCEFEFDFATVYWNPRLSSEHDRLVKLIEPGEVMYDVFAGVGPFTIPAAKRKINILANDLNPDSFKWLEHNVQKNKVTSWVKCFNQDGRAFIQETASKDLLKYLNSSSEDDKDIRFVERFHFVMNLPALAVEFLDSFWGILNGLKDETVLDKVTVVVHVYCFIKDVEGFKEKAVALVKQHLGYDLSSKNILQVNFVRNVAPNKEMLRVSFVLPSEVMTSDKCKAPKRKFSEIDDESSSGTVN